MRTADPTKSDTVRNGILRAAMELFRTYGLDKTTMEEIAKAAGKGKSTLHYYFKTKEDVFYAVASKEREKAFREIEKAVNARKNAPDRMRVFFSIRNKIIASKARLYPMIFKGTATKHLEFFGKMRRENNMEEVNLLKRILEEGVDSGEFGAIKKSDCGAMAVTAIAALHGMDLELLLDGKIAAGCDKMSTMSDTFIRGLK